MVQFLQEAATRSIIQDHQDLTEAKVIHHREVLKQDHTLLLQIQVAEDHQAVASVAAVVVADHQVAAAVVVAVEINHVSKILNEKIHTTPRSSYSSYYR